MTTLEIKKMLAKDMYARCPENVTKQRFELIKHYMFETYMKELKSTPEGLYTRSEIWKQTFNFLLR